MIAKAHPWFSITVDEMPPPVVDFSASVTGRFIVTHYYRFLLFHISLPPLCTLHHRISMFWTGLEGSSAEVRRRVPYESAPRLDALSFPRELSSKRTISTIMGSRFPPPPLSSGQGRFLPFPKYSQQSLSPGSPRTGCLSLSAYSCLTVSINK